MEENLMNGTMEATEGVEVTNLLPGYTGTQVLVTAGVSFLVGVAVGKFARPVVNKIGGLFKKKVTKDDLEVVEGENTEKVEDKAD